MLSDFILDAIDSVESVQDFNYLISKWKMSEASTELKEEAIRELKALKSIFDINPNTTHASVFQDILDGAADIKDMGN